jgi:GTP cyclohydrolase IA
MVKPSLKHPSTDGESCCYDSKLVATTHYPSPIAAGDALSDDEKIERIAEHFEQIMKILGLNLDDPSLAKTPRRVAKMYVSELFNGLNLDAFPSMTFVDDPCAEGSEDRLVLLKMGFTSFCEHHFVPMVGTAYIGYIPKGKLLGFSKFSRVVRYFSRRPQVQERLTAQIADALAMLLQTEDVAVSMVATHYCVVARGVEDENITATTLVLLGAFKEENDLRQRFLLHASSK